MRGAAQMMTEARPIQQSRTFLTDLVLPPDTNHHHTIFGGKVMAYVDKIACIAAMRHCRKPVVTASSDSFDFLAPIKTGEAENLLTGEKRMTARAYLTMIALDDRGKPTSVPGVIPDTEEERIQYEKAKERHVLRRKRKVEK